MQPHSWLQSLSCRFNGSLKVKLHIVLFIIGFVPYLLVLLYTLNLGEAKIIQSITQTQYAQVDKIKHDVEQQMDSLEREVLFLSQLEVMDDMIVGDIDKRISRLLTQKKRDMNLDLEFYCVDLANTIVASSSLNKLQQSFTEAKRVKDAASQHHVYYFDDATITLFSPIRASFEDQRFIGYLLLTYHLDDLNRFNLHQNDVHSVLVNTSSISNTLAQQQSVVLNLHGKNGNYSTDEEMVLYKALDGVLEGWYAVYMIKKSLALAFIDDFILFLGLMSFIGLLFISLLSNWISNQIVKPVVTLTAIAEKIVDTEDYSNEVVATSSDEIGNLSRAFNTLVRQTDTALSALEEENKFRLQRFVQLIDIFNRIIKTQSEEECIETTLYELQKLINERSCRFTNRVISPEIMGIPLFVKDYELGERHYYGAIILEGEPSHDMHELQFYASIGTMIMLQLDQIGLIKRTKEVSKAKSVFISHMSHELRTPLHAIITSSQYLITYGTLIEEQLMVVANVENAAQHLLSMINDIIDVARIEAGKVPVVLEPLNLEVLEEMFIEVISMLEPLAEEKETSLFYSRECDATLTIEVDSKLLKQILINLLSNAIKFTQNGTITLRVDTDYEFFWLHVIDTGIGIAPESLGEVFHDFTQVGEGNQQGSGLGLSISRKLARLLGGDVTLSSAGIGKGTEAVITLRCV